MRLRGILEHKQVMRLCKFTNRGHIRQATVQVHHQNGTGLFRAGFRQSRSIQHASVAIRFHKYRHKSRSTYCENGRHECIRRNNHFVARLQAPQLNRRLQHQGQRIEAITDSDTSLFTTIGCKSLFERSATRTANKPL